MEMGWGWGCALWVWGRDGSEMDGDVMGTVVRHMKMGWGWENVMGMGLIFTKTVSLFNMRQRGQQSLYTVSGKKRGHSFLCIALANVDTVS